MDGPSRECIAQRRAQWRYRGHQRPNFAVMPGPGQESVWDYPRPPAIEENYRPIEIYAGKQPGEQLVAASRAGFRVLETAGAPTFYLPADDVECDLLARHPGHSFCEWKGQADYWALRNDAAETVAWTYPDPFTAYTPLAGCYAFYPALLACFLDGEPVRPQPGGFYGGWVTDDITGPFKGEAATANW